MSTPILVVGATGMLGGNVTRRLVAAGLPVRAMVRDPARIGVPGVEVVRGDLRDPASLRSAVQGMGQVLTTANSFLGKGATSPTKVDVPGYTALVRAAREAGVERIVHVSAYGVAPGSPVDYFRVKAQVDQAIQQGGVPWVLLKPSAFMDIWYDVAAKDLAKKGTMQVFGDGTAVSNYIAVDDVAEFCVRVLAQPEIRNEVIDLGGPSNLSGLDFVAAIGRARGVTPKVAHVPLPVLRFLPPLLRPFNEFVARLMSMGYWTATTNNAMPHWRAAADRFGVAPLSVEAWLAQRS